MRVRIPSEHVIKIPLFARYFGSNVLIDMKDYDGKADEVDIDYIYMAFKERLLAELKAEGCDIAKVDTSQQSE